MGCPALNNDGPLNNVALSNAGSDIMLDSHEKNHECKENESELSDGIELKERKEKKSSQSMQIEEPPQTMRSKYNEKSLV